MTKGCKEEYISWQKVCSKWGVSAFHLQLNPFSLLKLTSHSILFKGVHYNNFYWFFFLINPFLGVSCSGAAQWPTYSAETQTYSIHIYQYTLHFSPCFSSLPQEQCLSWVCWPWCQPENGPPCQGRWTAVPHGNLLWPDWTPPLCIPITCLWPVSLTQPEDKIKGLSLNKVDMLFNLNHYGNL